MNFNEIYRKIVAIENNQPIEECGSTMGSSYTPPPQSDSVNMNVSMSGSGQGGIRDLLNILKDLDQSEEQPHAHADTDVVDILKLAGGKTMLPGNDGLEDPGSDMDMDFDLDKKSEEFVNQPDENYDDVSAMTHDNAGGLNAPHQQFKKEYPGDNPMAESLRNKLSVRYQQYK